MQDTFYLLKALELAKIRRGFCAPNPSVGAVVVKDQQIIGEGYHYQAGMPHAEVNAIKALTKTKVKGATVYVTLEPCCHFGRTPPCTALLIESQVARVVYGYQDPNHLVAGQGAQQLRAAGIICDYLPLEEIRDFYQSYQFWNQYNRPWLTAKLALSKDNKVALANRVPVAITNEVTRCFTHQQRLHSDAILTSVETIIQDDPALNVRLEETVSKPVYIIDRQLQLPLSARVLKTASKVTVFYDENNNSEQLAKLQQHGVHSIKVPITIAGHLSLTKILEILGQTGLHDVWLEAGPRLFQAFIQEHLAQSVYLYHSPLILGDNAYSANFPSNLLQHYKQSRSFELDEVKINLYNLFHHF